MGRGQSDVLLAWIVTPDKGKPGFGQDKPGRKMATIGLHSGDPCRASLYGAPYQENPKP